MATPIKDKLVNLEILKSSQDYIDNKKINKNQGTQNNGKFMRVGADGNLVPDNVPIPDVSGQIKEHNENTDSHQDIRTELKKKANSGTTLSDYGITDAVPDSHLTDSKAHEDIRKETAKLKDALKIRISTSEFEVHEKMYDTQVYARAYNIPLENAVGGKLIETSIDMPDSQSAWIDMANSYVYNNYSSYPPTYLDYTEQNNIE